MLLKVLWGQVLNLPSVLGKFTIQGLTPCALEPGPCNIGIASGYQRCVDLDHWIRRRVRMAYWRQWRKPRTKVRSLMRLGIHVRSAVACGITSTNSRRF